MFRVVGLEIQSFRDLGSERGTGALWAAMMKGFRFRQKLRLDHLCARQHIL